MSDCVIWSGGLTDSGYGSVKRLGPDGRRVSYAHRWVWIQKHGPIPAGMVVMHACDVPACVNLDHLSVGTQRDNVHDSMAKGRFSSNVGIDNPRAKLNYPVVREVRRRLAAGATQREVAQEFGVSRSCISDVQTGRCWSEVVE
jgi:DNA-binding XRE family transcriptional regulator